MPLKGLVHVIDDDDAVRDSLKFLLETEDYDVRGWASADEFLARDGKDGDCIVSDVRMPGMTGIDLVRELAARGPFPPVVMITGHGDVPLAVEAMKAGVADFIEKPFEDETILRAIATAMKRGPVTAPRPDRSAEAEEAMKRLSTLSTREREVMAGIVAGALNKTIAYDLGISPRTVEVYRANVMSKMGAGSLSELVRMAIAAEG